jgi:uncharacterized phage protein (TIGR01671 family)
MMIPKFRAWDKEQLCWINIATLNFDGEFWYLAPAMDDFNPVYYQSELGETWELMQSTGMKDKNGVEIFEGDVLFHPLQGRRKVFYPYSETVASYGLRNIDNGFGSTLQDSHAVWEVIGNIYEQPELLNNP